MRNWSIFFLVALGVFFIDTGIKELFLSGYEWYSRCISLELYQNRGVAFSMLSFLGDWLKWILAVLIASLFIYFYKDGLLKKHPLIFGILLGASIGNLYDRFVYGYVIDYVYWHCGFDFAVFNFADVMIDISVGLLLLNLWIEKKKDSI